MMKTYLGVVIGICVMAGAVGCATNQTATSGTELNTVTYEVFGMDCPGCHGGVEKNVARIPGVESVQANWKAQTLTIFTRAGVEVSATEIAAAVKASNFTIGERID